MSVRWQINKAGIFNFWHYYDETEYRFSAGRLIFRGANGSGKSVTMQSFLPLVLDGDKRPTRLDPFQSRDRKVEFYLLGEQDSGMNDRIGYLYLEFKQPHPGKYMTIGIGLRAKRGAAQVGFWGFAVTDNRRIGKDLFLYDAAQYEKEGRKYPLDRSELEAAIGSGGRVVREQGEYRKLVNSLLFGYENIEDYKELLDLLIQLRSPKLSKDFKPSTIYGILTASLPPLGDEELRPLSEVMESMDEIGERLDELVRHAGEAERLERAYTTYNEMMLLDRSGTLLRASETHGAKDRELREERRASETLAGRMKDVEHERQQANGRIESARTELQTLEKSEAYEKRQELEHATDQLEVLEEDQRRQQRRLGEDQRALADKRKREEAERLQQERLQTELDDLAEQLDGAAADIEFADHQFYGTEWRRPEGADEAVWARWKKDVGRYRDDLKAAAGLGRSEQALHAQVKDAEREVSEVRLRKDEAERAMQAGRGRFEEALKRQEDALFGWMKGLGRIRIEQAQWQQTYALLQDYPATPYTAVVAPLRAGYDNTRQDRIAIRLEREHGLKQLAGREDDIRREIKAWSEQRDPEPPRSENRAGSRQRRAGVSRGAPLYQVVEFAADVDEPLRAVLETSLHEAGLLDIWVAAVLPELDAGDEDSWLVPNPALLGHTLADYLEPGGYEAHGLTYETVDAVLRTIRIGEGGDDGESGAAIGEDGRYRLGPLHGRTAAKPHAEWIGAEARKETRRRKIAELELQLEEVQREQEQIRASIRDIEREIAEIEREWSDLPEEGELVSALAELQTAEREFAYMQSREQAADEKFRRKLAEWKAEHARWTETVSRWSRLKSLRDLEEALDGLGEYESGGSEYRSKLIVARRVAAELESIAREASLLEEQIAETNALLYDNSRKIAEWKTKKDTLLRLLEESGLHNIHLRIEALKREIKQLDDELKRLETQSRDLLGKHAASMERVRQKEELKQAAEQELADARHVWKREWSLRLALEDQFDYSPEPDMEQAVAFARKAVSRLKAKVESRKMEAVASALHEAFSIAKNALLEYVLEQRFDESLGRIVVEANRDRNRPWTPAVLLAELRKLEEEQRLLLSEKDRELYEQILIHSVGRAIKEKINRADAWVREMNRFMQARQTSSGLVLSLEWKPKAARSERELDTERLVRLLRKDPRTLQQEEIDRMVEHFRSRIRWAKEEAGEGEGLRRFMQEMLDYRQWFDFTLYYRKSEQPRRELTDSRFNVFSGGEKAMAMYIPLFAAADSRYKDARPEAPRVICLDEAFAGVDDQNLRDMFQLLTGMGFDYMMTSQVLWGCYDTVPELSIYEIHRPNDGDILTVIPYYWNGRQRTLMFDTDEAAAAQEEVEAASVGAAAGNRRDGDDGDDGMG